MLFLDVNERQPTGWLEDQASSLSPVALRAAA
jgi:hypothetical protein